MLHTKVNLHDSELRALGRRSLSFCPPRTIEYESQKRIRVVQSRQDVFLDGLHGVMLPPALRARLAQFPDVERAWDCFYSKRIALAWGGAQAKVASVFPGNTIPAFRNVSGDRIDYRGSLMLEQHLCMMHSNSNVAAMHYGVSRTQVDGLRVKALESGDETWPWLFVSKPKLFVISAAIADESPGGVDGYFGELSTDAHTHQQAVYRRGLEEQLERCMTKENYSTEQLLQWAHRTWTTTRVPNYDVLGIEIAQHVMRAAASELQHADLLPVIFELEALASYLARRSSLDIFASGFYHGNWLEVGTIPLSQCRGTELCITDRLFEEVFNLPTRGFAPVVVNEFGCIADGNHRLTSVWIWNLLKTAADCEWDLSSYVLQTRIANYVRTFEEQLGPVSTHEALRHLGKFLENSETRQRMNNQLKPLIRRHSAIAALPAVPLNEYCSASVVKDLYDQGLAVVRAHPNLYAALAENSNAVLPPRASYHFTDCAPLPWFTVIENEQMERRGHRHAVSKSPVLQPAALRVPPRSIRHASKERSGGTHIETAMEFPK